MTSKAARQAAGLGDQFARLAPRPARSPAAMPAEQPSRNAGMPG